MVIYYADDVIQADQIVEQLENAGINAMSKECSEFSPIKANTTIRYEIIVEDKDCERAKSIIHGGKNGTSSINLVRRLWAILALLIFAFLMACSLFGVF